MAGNFTTEALPAVDSQFLDGSAFVAAIETALANGESDIVAMNIDTLERLIADLSSRKKHLDELVRRACDARHRYQVLSAGPAGSYVSETV